MTHNAHGYCCCSAFTLFVLANSNETGRPKEPIMQMNRQLVEMLKQSDAVFAAGAVAHKLGYERNSYGCHYGMRSTLQRDRAEFERGWDASSND